MPTRKYFQLKSDERKWVAIDLETHTVIQQFAKEREISMAEAVNILIGPAIAALNGIDYELVLDHFDLRQQTDTQH